MFKWCLDEFEVEFKEVRDFWDYIFEDGWVVKKLRVEELE